MIWTESTTGHTRIGLIVARHQSSAVARNRLRRRLREIWRRDIRPAAPPLPPWDVIVRARREAYGATFEQLQNELRTWREHVAPSR
jgi:ribonuclease P protein component